MLFTTDTKGEISDRMLELKFFLKHVNSWKSRNVSVSRSDFILYASRIMESLEIRHRPLSYVHASVVSESDNGGGARDRDSDSLPPLHPPSSSSSSSMHRHFGEAVGKGKKSSQGLPLPTLYSLHGEEKDKKSRGGAGSRAQILTKQAMIDSMI